MTGQGRPHGPSKSPGEGVRESRSRPDQLTHLLYILNRRRSCSFREIGILRGTGNTSTDIDQRNPIAVSTQYFFKRSTLRTYSWYEKWQLRCPLAQCSQLLGLRRADYNTQVLFRLVPFAGAVRNLLVPHLVL